MELKTGITTAVLGAAADLTGSTYEGYYCGCRVFDLIFTKPCSNCNAIQLVNNHTHSISLLFQSNFSCEWKILLWDHLLVPNPHTVGRDCENWVTLFSDLFLNEMEDVTSLRVILRQPSPHWKEFGVANISLFSARKLAPCMEYKFPHTSSEQYYEVDLLP